MKKRNAFLSLFFGTIVLAALLLQSIHAIHHIDASFKEKKMPSYLCQKQNRNYPQSSQF
jgi:hypothetical protein